MMKKTPLRRKLFLERLEPRTLLAVAAGGEAVSAVRAAPTESAVWEVNTAEDPSSWNTSDETVSLREAIARAAAGDTIVFSPSLSGTAVTLNGNQLEIFKGIAIDGASAGGITIDADEKSTVFYIKGGTESLPVTLTGLTITGGKGYNGGGICCYGVLNADGCLIFGNSAGYGGGIYSSGGRLTLAGSTVAENSADNYGGGIYASGSLTVASAALFLNSAASGAGLYLQSGSAALTNCAVCENGAAYNGGGIYSSAGSLTLTNCTIAANSAGDHYAGGGVYNSARTAEFYNTLIVQNWAGSNADIRRYSGALRACNTLSSYTDWTESSDCPVYDPALPLFRDAYGGDFTLAEDSQAINRGSNTFIEGTGTDLAGNPRIADKTVDLGAYEYSACSPRQLAAPDLLTGTGTNFAAAGADRHRLTWTESAGASGYEVMYSADGSTWTRFKTEETNAEITGLPYGAEICYSVRALGEGNYADSNWCAEKSFRVCPMDINGDGDISNPDRAFLTALWLTGEGDDEFLCCGDINGDGDVSNPDRAFLISNWLCESEEEELLYPPAKGGALPAAQNAPEGEGFISGSF